MLSVGEGRSDATIVLHTVPGIDRLDVCLRPTDSGTPCLPRPLPEEAVFPLIITLGSHCNSKLKVCLGPSCVMLVCPFRNCMAGKFSVLFPPVEGAPF
jgi:hypothetical protein